MTIHRWLSTALANAAARASSTANRQMVPDGGGISIIYDAVTCTWTAWYSVQGRTIGFQGQGNYARDAVRHMEQLNMPHPEFVEAQLQLHDQQ